MSTTTNPTREQVLAELDALRAAQAASVELLDRMEAVLDKLEARAAKIEEARA